MAIVRISRLCTSIFCLICIFLSPAIAAQPIDAKMSGEWIKPQDGKPDGGKTIIVFVHGLTGDFSTWSRRKNEQGWPEIVAKDQLFSDADVYKVQYASSFFGKGLKPPQIAVALASKLRSKEVNISRYENIVFVAHSLGGIIVRELVLSRANDDLRPNIKALFFFAVPGGGAEIANWGALFPASEVVRFLQNRRIYGDYLDQLSKKWINLEGKDSIKTYCAYESKGLRIGMIRAVRVVHPRSAERLCTDSFQEIEADHLEIVKPVGPNDISHIWLRTWYQHSFPNSILALSKEENRPVLFATCAVESYGKSNQAAIAKETASAGSTMRISQELPHDWNVQSLRYLWQKFEPRVIVIHLSCFREIPLKHEDYQFKERDQDFLGMLKTLEPFRVKVLVYSQAFGNDPRHLDSSSIVNRFQVAGRLKKFPTSLVRSFSGDAQRRNAFRAELIAMLKQ